MTLNYQREYMQSKQKRRWACLKVGISNVLKLINFLRFQSSSTELSQLKELEELVMLQNG